MITKEYIHKIEMSKDWKSKLQNADALSHSHIFLSM